MPIYEYVCPKCQHPFEKLVSFSNSEKPQPCPACGHEEAIKRVSLVAGHVTGANGAPASTGASCGPVG